MLIRILRRVAVTAILFSAIALYSLGVLRIESTNPALHWLDEGSGWLTRIVVAQGNGGPGDAIHAAADWLEGNPPAVPTGDEGHEG